MFLKALSILLTPPRLQVDNWFYPITLIKMTKPIKPISSFIAVFQDCMVVVPNIVPIRGLTIESESLAADRSKHLNAL